jgi:uncharacterized protein YecE (DUF72 family)
MKHGNVIRIGTSGWHYKHWKGTFYPTAITDAGQLEYYQQVFNTVELNNTFYNLPKPETFDGWKEKTGDDFIFAVKGSRFITHMKKLHVVKDDVRRFFAAISRLEVKLGPVLFQLPPAWKLNLVRLGEFLSILPKENRYVFEFRNQTWYVEEVYALLRQYNCAFCIYELAGHLSPEEVTSDIVYIRLHGPGEKYQGSYSDLALKKWGNKCLRWQKEGKDVYVYFDNDQAGYAAFNALKLRELVNKH